jgi:para-aminobenzoate synthetase component 1
MTGAPKVEAMHLLERLEAGPRGWYSGVLGHVGFNGDLDLSVVIRTALLSEAEVACHVGGGVVFDSTCECEWDEALDKGPWALSERA